MEEINMILNFSEILSNSSSINLNDFFIEKECYQRFSSNFSFCQREPDVLIDSEKEFYYDESLRSCLLLKESDDLQF